MSEAVRHSRLSRAVAGLLVISTAGLVAVAYHERREIAARARIFIHPGQPSIPPGSVAIHVDANADLHPISPYIYGASAWNPDSTAGLHAALVRWGGNPSSRYNWVRGDSWNAAADWEFRNNQYVRTPGSASDRFVSVNRSRGAGSIVTIPALGWVARSNDNNDRSFNVPQDGGPASGPDGQVAGYDPAANRARTSVPSYARKPGPFVLNPDRNSPSVYEDEWVNHLVSEFGAARSGGVGFYAIDNEPSLWSQTHTDVHPARVGYDELARTFLEYADAVKSVDPTSQVLGPESWGWLDYSYSELDRGSDNFGTHADRNAHGGTALTPWFLQTVRKHDLATGHRSLDVLAIHYYPQGPGVGSERSSPTLDATRLRATDSLWNPGYVDESWIAQPVDLIPRMKSWITDNYPGTKLGITEYNFGGGGSISAALAEADALGIFGREQVYLANYWFGPKIGSPAAAAFAMFRDYDGHGAGFGSTSVRSTSSSASTVSAYSSRERGWLDIMLVNKNLTGPATVSVQIAGTQVSGAAQRYQYSAKDLAAIHTEPPLDAAGGGLAATLPAGSITLLRLPLAG